MPYQLVWRGYCRRTGSCRAPRWEKASWRRRWRERALRRRSRAGGSLRVDCRFVSSYRDSNHWLTCEARTRITSADGSPADSVAVPVQSSWCRLTRVIASQTGQPPGRRRLNLVGINPIKALYYAAIVNGTIAPILMFFIFRIGRDEDVMGRFTNPPWVNFWGWVVTALMGGSAIALFVFAALGK